MAMVEIALRTILALVFAIAFISKVRSASAFGEFAGSLNDIGWLPRPGRATATRLIPLSEAAVVVLLLVPATVALGFGLGGLLLAGFTVVTGAEVANGRQVQFGWLPADCFAVFSEVGCAVVDAVHRWISAGGPFRRRLRPWRCLEED